MKIKVVYRRADAETGDPLAGQENVIDTFEIESGNDLQRKAATLRGMDLAKQLGCTLSWSTGASRVHYTPLKKE